MKIPRIGTPSNLLPFPPSDESAVCWLFQRRIYGWVSILSNNLPGLGAILDIFCATGQKTGASSEEIFLPCDNTAQATAGASGLI